MPDALEEPHAPGRRSLLLFVALTILRAPWLFVAPRFFAEEGIVYFRYALDHGAGAALVARHLGYYALVPNAAAALATELPLALAPYAPLCLAFFAQLAPAWIVAQDRRLLPSPRAKALAMVVLAFPLAMRREWLSTIHAQFWLALASCLMLVIAPRTRRAGVGFATITVAAALTGVVSVLLAPVYLALGAARRDARLLAQGTTLAAGILASLTALGERPTLTWDPRELLAIAVGKLFVVPFSGRLGAQVTEALFRSAASTSASVALALLVMGGAVIALRRLDPDARVLLLSGGYVGIVSLGGALGDHATLADPMQGIRYAFVPNVTLGLVLVRHLASAPRGPSTLGARIGVGVMVVVGVIGALSAARFADAGFAYRRDVRSHVRDRGHTLTMHAASCRLAPDAARARAGFAVRALDHERDGGARVFVRPAELDRDVPVALYVMRLDADGNVRAVLRGERFVPFEVSLIGAGALTRPGGCLVGDHADTLPARRRAQGDALTVDIPENALREVAPEETVVVGYGRSLADAVAKGTFAALDREGRPVR